MRVPKLRNPSSLWEGRRPGPKAQAQPEGPAGLFALFRPFNCANEGG